MPPCISPPIIDIPSVINNHIIWKPPYCQPYL